MRSGWVSMLILLFALSMLFAGQTLRDENGSDFDVNNATAHLEWKFNYTETNETIENIVNKGADFFGYTAVEFAKGTMRYGFNHPEYDFDYAFKFVKAVLIFVVVVAALAALPVLFAVLYLLGEGLFNLFLFIKKKVNK